jgi:hypothetical protein
MLKRRWSALIGAFLALAATVRETLAGNAHFEQAMEPVQPPHLADVREDDLAAALQLKPGTQIAPPERSMLIPHRQVWAFPQEEPFVHPSWISNGSRLLTVLTVYRNGVVAGASGPEKGRV